MNFKFYFSTAPPCIQPGRPDSSEDCLFLNLYTRYTSVEKPTKVPVFVFIGGNSLVTGSAESNVHGPEYLLDYLVVLVVIQYRLGALGFLSTGTEDAVGNIGFKDQAMALKFIKTHVSVFHGDPDKIVLFGGSAGSYSVSLHMVSPMSQKLFNSAIMMSGVIHPQKKYYPSQLDLAKEQAKYVCCLRSDIKAMVDCLRKVDAKKFAESAEKFLKFDLHPIYYWNPVIEPDFKQERFLTENPLVTYSSGKQAKIPMIVGLTENEEQVFVNRILKNDTLRREFDNPITGDHMRLAPIVFLYNDLTFDKIRALWKDYVKVKTLEYNKESSDNLKYMFRDGLLGFSMDRVVRNSIATQDVFFYFTGHAGSCSKFSEFGHTGNIKNISYALIS